jgi:hypothetical protein
MIINNGPTDLQMWQTNTICIITLTPSLVRWIQHTPPKFVQQIRGVQIKKKVYKLPQNSRRHRSDIKAIPHEGPRDIRRQNKNFIRHGYLAHEISASLH